MLLQTITSAVSFQAKNLLEEHPLHDHHLSHATDLFGTHLRNKQQPNTLGFATSSKVIAALLVWTRL